MIVAEETLARQIDYRGGREVAGSMGELSYEELKNEVLG
jgi:hypothetical protein